MLGHRKIKYTDVPKLNAKESNNNSTSTRFLTSTSYLSLQNISVGYTLPKNWIAKLGCESLRVYFVADNVALLLLVKVMTLVQIGMANQIIIIRHCVVFLVV